MQIKNKNANFIGGLFDVGETELYILTMLRSLNEKLQIFDSILFLFSFRFDNKLSSHSNKQKATQLCELFILKWPR